jgi:hypothetical protein
MTEEMNRALLQNIWNEIHASGMLQGSFLILYGKS